MPSPTATTSTGNVIKTPYGDANARAMRAPRGARLRLSRATVGCAVGSDGELWTRSGAVSMSVSRFVYRAGGQLEAGEEAALAAGGIEADACRPRPQIGRIVGRVRRQLV